MLGTQDQAVDVAAALAAPGRSRRGAGVVVTVLCSGPGIAPQPPEARNVTGVPWCPSHHGW